METDLNDSLNNSAIEAKRARSSSMIDDVHPSVRVAIEVNDIREVKHGNNGRRQMAKISSDVELVSSNP